MACILILCTYTAFLIFNIFFLMWYAQNEYYIIWERSDIIHKCKSRKKNHNFFFPFFYKIYFVAHIVREQTEHYYEWLCVFFIKFQRHLLFLPQNVWYLTFERVSLHRVEAPMVKATTKLITALINVLPSQSVQPALCSAAPIASCTAEFLILPELFWLLIRTSMQAAQNAQNQRKAKYVLPTWWVTS